MSLRFSYPKVFLILLTTLAIPAHSQQRRTVIAILDFGDSGVGRLAPQAISANLGSFDELSILDPDQARTAVRGAGHAATLNMSLQEARVLGAAIGSDYYIIGDAQTLRRSPSSGPIYFESYASMFLVDSRTGGLVMWQRPSFKGATAQVAEKLLLGELSSSETRLRNLAAIRRACEEGRIKREIAIDKGTPVIEEAPDDEGTADIQGLRLPRPYRRLTPPYPETAARAEVEATVDVLVDLDANGEVGRVEIARWAGFGLDESTVETVRRLHFFPALRNGAPIPLRVLLRYNFRKPPK